MTLHPDNPHYTMTMDSATWQSTLQHDNPHCTLTIKSANQQSTLHYLTMPDNQKCMPTAHICHGNQKSLPTIHTHRCLQLLCLVHEIVQTVTTLHYFLNVLCHDALNLINLRLESGHRVTACFGEVFLSRKIKITLQIMHNRGT